MTDEQKNSPNQKYLWVVLAAAAIFGGIVFLFAKYQNGLDNPALPKLPKNQSGQAPELRKFSSEQEFRDYIEKAKAASALTGASAGFETQLMKNGSALSLSQATDLSSAPSRVSGTNVQVAGIDEPDTVKTDGKEIYFSSDQPNFIPMRAEPETAVAPPQVSSETKFIKSFPPENMGLDAKIGKNGDLLLEGKTLVIIPSENSYWNRNESKIYGYDVSNPKNPKEIWNIELNNSTSIAGARLVDGKIYLALKTDLNPSDSCLLRPVVVQNADFSIKCTDIYHPVEFVPSDSTYTAMVIDPISGKIEKNVSVVGSSDLSATVIYMSPRALYLAYYNPGNFLHTFNIFLNENKNVLPEWLVEKLGNLEGYDISDTAKMTEVSQLVNRYQISLSDDDRLKVQNEIENRMGEFLSRHRREIDSTGIVKVNLQSLEIEASGQVPGKILNQFSLDEFNGDLRLATTVGENFFGGFGFGSASRSSDMVNDVHVLGKNLEPKGSVADLGKGERIYAVRFVGNRGFVVTFKRIDPLFVLDLSSPENPVLKGELEIPGYSSYLHPLDVGRILGIGEENGKVKVSLFDVSNAENPQEASKYNLDEYFSEATSNHHAFLLDADHQIFFLPGTKGGYVFSYADSKLSLLKAISDFQIKRAVYIDKYLYVIGAGKVVVLDETNWEKIKELEF
jgi:uncharacterized secreted protein with C-terminal beta-propeller domain